MPSPAVPAVARELRERRHDVLAIADHPGWVALSDPDVMTLARTERRAVVTSNLRDYRPLHTDAITPGGPGHFGMIFMQAPTGAPGKTPDGSSPPSRPSSPNIPAMKTSPTASAGCNSELPTSAEFQRPPTRGMPAAVTTWPDRIGQFDGGVFKRDQPATTRSANPRLRASIPHSPTRTTSCRSCFPTGSRSA